MPRSLFLLSLLAVVGCGGISDRTDDAAAFVTDQFAESNAQGRVGLEVKGKGVWFRASHFDSQCLMKNDLGFRNDPKAVSGGQLKRLLSPVYEAQRDWVYSTERGYCIFVGSDPTVRVVDTNYINGAYRVDIEVGLASPAAWGKCLHESAKSRTIEVKEGADGAFSIAGGDISLGQGACPTPLPEAIPGKPKPRPKAKPSKKPTKNDVVSAVKKFDEALRKKNYQAAYDAISCFNVFAEKKYNSCSPSDLIGLAPMTKKGDNFFEAPWNDAVFSDLKSFGAIKADRMDKTMFHVMLRDKRQNMPRSLTVQWVDGQYKLMGVVSMKGEGMTTPRFVYDMHVPQRRKVFEKRLKGEPIDEKGNNYDPFADYDE